MMTLAYIRRGRIFLNVNDTFETGYDTVRTSRKLFLARLLTTTTLC